MNPNNFQTGQQTIPGANFLAGLGQKPTPQMLASALQNMGNKKSNSYQMQPGQNQQTTQVI